MSKEINLSVMQSSVPSNKAGAVMILRHLLMNAIRVRLCASSKFNNCCSIISSKNLCLMHFAKEEPITGCDSLINWNKKIWLHLNSKKK